MAASDLVRALEERLVNVWPAVDTLVMDGWVIRLAHGYSSRANSASAIVQGATMSGALLDEIERIFAAANLTPCVRVTPVCDPAVEALLLGRGYRVKDSSRIMVLDLAAHRGLKPDPLVTIDRCPTDRWIHGVCANQAPDKRNAAHLGQIVRRIRVPAGFAIHSLDGADVAFAMAAMDRGYAEIGSVIVAEGRRGQGLGRAMTDALLAFGASEGAHHAFLQVASTNAPAIGLYRSQGFVDVGGYLNMVRP
jgi:N-acetylglutamate synthase